MKVNYKTPILSIIAIFAICGILWTIANKEINILSGTILIIYITFNTLYVTWDDCFKL